MAAIHTLNARDSVLLEVVSEYFSLSDLQMQHEIRGAHAHVVDVLSAKGIDYASLRNGLTPQTDRDEVTFVFDTARIDAGWYGGEVAERIVPLLDPRLTCSILTGDLLLKDQDRAFELLADGLLLHKPCEIAHTSQLYGVYVNNLSQQMVRHVHEGLLGYDAYIGLIPCTYSSLVKNWMSITLCHAYLKHKRWFICGHEDDRDDSEDVNTYGWPLEENGYEPRSLQSMYFDLFLGYKIERAVFPGFESDTLFGLAAISDRPQALAAMDVRIDGAKLRYLRERKAGSLSAAGVADVTVESLAHLIKERIGRNYIYNLRFGEDHGRSLFSVVLELRNPLHETPTRLVAGFDYSPEVNGLRLVTLF